MKVGDRVKRADANENSIPAYRNMRGTVVEVTRYDGWVKIQWDCDGTPEFGTRHWSTLIVIEE